MWLFWWHRWLSPPSLLTGFPSGSNAKEFACNAGDPGLIPGSGGSPGEWNDNPLQYSCLESPWPEKPGGLQFMGLQTVWHNWATSLTFTIDWCDITNTTAVSCLTSSECGHMTKIKSIVSLVGWIVPPALQNSRHVLTPSTQDGTLFGSERYCVFSHV